MTVNGHSWDVLMDTNGVIVEVEEQIAMGDPHEGQEVRNPGRSSGEAIGPRRMRHTRAEVPPRNRD